MNKKRPPTDRALLLAIKTVKAMAVVVRAIARRVAALEQR